ncbi:hypothetical protein DFH09DRAFT_230789 [Mycena vulgaris]|nr:hypothetical protein DFH09DRAFT_230789 [Mycena vulgaris]
MDDSPLPLEIEREIFELAARATPERIPLLLAVSHPVKTWIEPIRFRTIVFSEFPNPNMYSEEPAGHYMSMAQFLHVLDSKPLSFFRDHVRHLYFAHIYKPAQMRKVICACNAATSVVICEQVEPSLLPILSALPLQRLTINLGDLFPGGPDFSHALFSTITHLEISEPTPSDWGTWSGLTHMLKLTHLALEHVGSDVYMGALRNCKSLAVLLCISWGSAEFGSDNFLDPRFVALSQRSDIFMSRDLWIAGADGGRDRWVEVEEIVAKQRAVMAQVNSGTQ